MRRQRRNLIALSVAGLIGAMAGCGDPGKPEFTVSAGPLSREYSTRQETAAVQSALRFAQDFVIGYRKSLRESVPPGFRDQFLLGDKAVISAWAVISTTRESGLRVYPSSNSTFQYYITNLPAQVAMACGLDSTGDRFRVLLQSAPGRLSNYLAEYDATSSAVLANPGSWFVLHGGSFVGPNPKCFDLRDSSYVLLDSFSPIWKNGDSVVSAVRYRRYTLIGGDKDLGMAAHYAGEIGGSMANGEISELLQRSDLFRMAIADPVLGPMAKAIASKEDQAKRDPNSYRPWQRRKDYQDLRTKADSMGIEDTTYYGDLVAAYLDYERTTLLWTSESRVGYSIQWSLFNIVFSTLLLLWYRLLATKLPSWLQKPAFERLVFFVFILAVNSYAWNNAPSRFNLLFLLAPLVTLLLYIVVWTKCSGVTHGLISETA